MTEYCGKERPPRKVFCQLPKDHEGSHRAVVFWEENEDTASLVGPSYQSVKRVHALKEESKSSST